MKILATHDEIVKMARACATGHCIDCALVDFCYSPNGSPGKIEAFCEMIEPISVEEALKNVK